MATKSRSASPVGFTFMSAIILSIAAAFSAMNGASLAGEGVCATAAGPMPATRASPIAIRISVTKFLTMEFPRLPTKLIVVVDHRMKHPTHFDLGLPDPGLKRGKIRRIAGPRHDLQKVFAGGFRIEPVADAEPQDLRQIVIKQRCRPQYFR